MCRLAENGFLFLISWLPKALSCLLVSAELISVMSMVWVEIGFMNWVGLVLFDSVLLSSCRICFLLDMCPY